MSRPTTSTIISLLAMRFDASTWHCLFVSVATQKPKIKQDERNPCLVYVRRRLACLPACLLACYFGPAQPIAMDGI